MLKAPSVKLNYDQMNVIGETSEVLIVVNHTAPLSLFSERKEFDSTHARDARVVLYG